jgi:hypothetical protein
MRELHVPGVSVAVIHNDRIDWARGFGVTRWQGPAVNPATLFEACSISKPVSAMAMLTLVQQGKVDLDKDVNVYLKGWKLPDNEFTRKSPVTLRQLLHHAYSHSLNSGSLGTSMTSPLEPLTGTGKPLAAEPFDPKEFEGLKRSALARLKDAANPANALESRLDLAYNAAHGLCLAALRLKGFRAHHRYIVFQVLPHTLGLGPEVWRILDKAHQTRNLGEYEGDLNVDERIVTDVIEACRKIVASLEQQTVIPTKKTK